MSETEDILATAGFVQDVKQANHWRHPDGRWAVVARNPQAGKRSMVTGFIETEVLHVRVHPANGGYPREFRQHFAPVFRELEKFLAK